MIIDAAISGTARVKDKELEKIEKYQLLREEVRKLWKLKKVTVVPVVIGALGAVYDKFDDKHIEKLGTTIRLELIQKTALLGTARLLRNVLVNQKRTPLGTLGTCCYSLSREIIGQARSTF